MDTKKPSVWLSCKMVGHSVIVVTSLWLRMLVGRANAKTMDEHLVWFWKGLLRISRTRVCVKRLGHFPANKTYVYMSNHLSHMDIPVIFATVQGHLRMVMKRELERLPLFGSILLRLGFVSVDRQNPTQGFKQLQQAQKRMLEGASIWIAPEGSRSRTGQLGRLRRGGFHLAIQLGVPIVPIWIDGTQRVLPPGGRAVRCEQTVTTYVGDPITTQGLQLNREGIADLMQRFQTCLMQLKKQNNTSSKGFYEQQPSTK